MVSGLGQFGQSGQFGQFGLTRVQNTKLGPGLGSNARVHDRAWAGLDIASGNSDRAWTDPQPDRTRPSCTPNYRCINLVLGVSMFNGESQGFSIQLRDDTRHLVGASYERG
ncbi:unnamed protein product [Camellia sinensis]